MFSFSKDAILFGVAVMLAFLVALYVIFPHYPLQVAAGALMVIGLVYPILLLSHHHSTQQQRDEVLAALVTYGLAVVGLVIWPWAVPIGLGAHAIWDFIKHNTGRGAKVVSWYPPMCIVVDLLAAAYVIVLLLIGWI
ncbi:hypothetical protein MXMO3_00436 [Maritalea myrionectae]|uniref:Uncharacterized protein n=1 Tax=Maritalea myrionectae TaxID=454601 RepID=A0A2R4MAE6_9HYPH|nr:hypothetical protein [Maritalea myrionectae]AVX02982.1 hypothetical protein MXMO3_00436 [Maritalea myrionectae]